MAQCTVCHDAASKYKCPKCLAGYCSVKCFKIHKSEPCAVPAPEPPKPTPKPQVSANIPEIDNEEEEEKHRLKLADLQKLSSSIHLKEQLQNPNLRTLIAAALSDPDPVAAIRSLRQQQPEFEALAQELISTTQ
ncbi:hypothetical protein DL89DRAFT_6737 [Linderina pennispora]|uniref:HIT-type domain-containing protein n=1 Tax=Linderina pennispora TaxID=61395 RepID=A0A1Y1WKT6_9FUNG|nr:uncharacterized protein DL89DRAFT_6737 [Linderina pennispora]ORX73928.1 hypothetical protein DL89DRAFT_6737 [Linderina pennispora]